MHDTSTEYKQMHNKKTISWNDNWILIFYLFHGYTPSWSFCFIIFFIHDIIISYPNAKMYKRFFKNWVLHIPHRLRDLLWIMRARSLVAPIFPFSYYESSFFLCALFSEFDESNHFLLEHISRMNESHDLRRPFKVFITMSYSSSIASS